MFSKRDGDAETNFWLSYADLMAGLLFVFILLIGAIIVKSTLLKSNLANKEASLRNSNQQVSLRDRELKRLQKLLAQRSAELNATQHNLRISKDALKLKTKEIINLNNILLSQTTQLDSYTNKIIILQNLLQKSDATIHTQRKKLQEYNNSVYLLSNTLTKKEQQLKLNNEKLLTLLEALNQKETQYDALVAKLQAQRAKIKSLTGIKIKVIGALKAILKDKVRIDPKSGALELASNILFDKGSAHLKESAKKELKALFIEYVLALTSNPTIAKQLDRIVIEGHNDSDGGYLYNLNLSQKRAFAVMRYLLTLEFTKQHHLQELLVASGRSYLDPVRDAQGVEQKDASRRIVIKFQLKNDDAMQEIEKILE